MKVALHILRLYGFKCRPNVYILKHYAASLAYCKYCHDAKLIVSAHTVNILMFCLFSIEIITPVTTKTYIRTNDVQISIFSLLSVISLLLPKVKANLSHQRLYALWKNRTHEATMGNLLSNKLFCLLIHLFKSLSFNSGIFKWLYTLPDLRHCFQ